MTVNQYGYEVLDNGVRCECGATFPVADGSIMRGHARRCAVNPRDYYVPAVCDS